MKAHEIDSVETDPLDRDVSSDNIVLRGEQIMLRCRKPITNDCTTERMPTTIKYKEGTKCIKISNKNVYIYYYTLHML